MQQTSVAMQSSTHEPKRIYDVRHQGGWGRDWRFMNYDHSKEINTVCGHLTPLPRVADEFHSPMSSGKVAVFAVTSVDYCGDPPDMFFAKVHFTGYAD